MTNSKNLDDRVKWFCERSLRNRAHEERQILDEEFNRTIRSYSYLQSVWVSQGKKQSDPGSCAYAYKQASMLERLARDCMIVQDKVIAKSEVYDKWYSKYSHLPSSSR